ncbi:MAG: hypothetical protein AAB438_00720 [Patescibacteria group bacterium]
MEKEETQINIKDKILNEIQSGDISMRPRFQFTLRLIALSALTFFILLISVFILTFISFSARISHHDELLGFGFRGFLAFLLVFPWFFLIVDIILIFLLERCLRNFKFGYRFPVFYLFLVLLSAVLIFGLGLDRGTSFNDSILERREHLPRPIGNFYNQANRPMIKGEGLCFCKILAIGNKKLIVEDSRKGGTVIDVLLPNDLPLEIFESLTIGDTVLIAGQERDGVIEAFGIRNIPNMHLERLEIREQSIYR